MLPQTRFARVLAAPPQFPNIGNTGIPPGTVLSDAAGFTASTNGVTYTAKNFTGNVDVTATGVVFQSCRINGGLFYAIHIEAGADATLNDCDSFGTVAGTTPLYNQGAVVLNRTHLHDGDSQLLITAGTFVANDCLFDDFWGRNTGGRTITDGAVTVTSTTLSSPSQANFVIGDVGANVWGNGIPNDTRIAGFTNSTTVTMDKAGYNTLSGVTVGIADNSLANHTECVKFTGGGTGNLNHCTLMARWGPHGSNGGGMTGPFHCSGGNLTVDTSLLVLYDGAGSYCCYFVSGYGTAIVKNSVLDHFDANHIADQVHQLSYDAAVPIWQNNRWVNGTVCP